MNNIAKEIQVLRRQFGLSPSELAEQSGLSPAYISKLEDGKYQSLSLTTCKALARGFGINLRDFLESIHFLDNNKNRPSKDLIGDSFRIKGYTEDEIIKIKEYAELLKRASR